MCAIQITDLKKSAFVVDNNNSYLDTGHLDIVGKLNQSTNSTSSKIIKKINIFKNETNPPPPNFHIDIKENLQKIASYYEQFNKSTSSLPLYKDIDQEVENKNKADIEQLISNTFLLAKNEKQFVIDKFFYNCFNNIENPIMNNYSDKKISVSMNLKKDTDLLERKCSISGNSDVQSTRNYNERRSSIVSSVINDLNTNHLTVNQNNNELLKSFMMNHDENISINDSNASSVLTSDTDDVTRITEHGYSSPTILSDNNSSHKTAFKNNFALNSRPSSKSSNNGSLTKHSFYNHKPLDLNLKYETALNSDPRVIILPSIMCKSPSEDSQRHRDMRRLISDEYNMTQSSEISNDNDNNNNNSSIISSNSSDYDFDQANLSPESNGILRVNSRFGENNALEEESNFVLTGKSHLLRGSINIKNKHRLPCLLLNNIKVMLCGYKLSYEHLILNDKLPQSSMNESFSAKPESINGLRITKPFIKKEVDLLDEKGYTVILNEKTFSFEILIDSREFPANFSCAYGKIEYRLECYINAINVGNIIVNDKVVIIKSLEPSMSNLIDQNDSVLKKDNPLTVCNKFLEGYQWRARCKHFDYKKESLTSLINEDDYLNSFNWERMMLQNPNLEVPEDIVKQLETPKLLYDVFLPSKTIIFNEPFQFYFKLKATEQCVNDWNVTECVLALEQHYCFPRTTKLNEKGEKCRTDTMKYKKVFLYQLLSEKYSLKQKIKTVCFDNVKVESDLAIYDSVFTEHKETDPVDFMNKIVPHYDELNTLYPETNKMMKGLLNISHKLKIIFTIETICHSNEKGNQRLKKQFSMSLPIFLITSYTLSTMTLPEYEE